MSTKSIRQAIVAQIATINGEAGGYTHSLTGTNQVKSGKYKRPPAGRGPFVCVWTAQVDENLGPVLTDREQIGTFIVLGWIQDSPKHPDARQDAAEDLMDDIRRALRATPRLDGTVTKFTVSASPFEDEADQGTERASYGVTMLAISATWRER